MRRLIRTLIFLALGGYVLTTGIPLVQSVDPAALGKIGELAQGAVPAVADQDSIGALLGDLKGIDVTDKGIVMQASDGREFALDFDVAQMTKSISEPSGNTTNDVVKYGAMGTLLSRLLYGFKGILALFTRRPHGAA